MGNIMTSFYTGVSGMHVNQTGLNTTAHNLSNVNTEGFTRQQVEMKDFYYTNVGYTALNTMQVGIGSDMAAIRQVRDTFLDRSYRTETGRTGFYSAQYEAVNEIEDLFGELEGEDFQTMVGDFWTALQELTREPDSLVNRATLLETAVSFTERAENIYKQLDEYQITLNTSIRKNVERINEIGDKIHELNKTIVRYESNGQNANDYRDTRNALLDELSGYAKISYSENPQGLVTVNLEGSQFVMEDHVFHLDTIPESDTTQMLRVVWENTTESIYDLTKAYSTAENTDIGSLKGILTARGNFKAKYTDIPTDTESATYAKDVEKYNNLLNPSIVMTVQAQFDQLVHGVVTTINDILCPNEDAASALKNLGVDVDNSTDFSITMNGTAKKLTEDDLKDLLIWDEYNAPVDANQNATREALFERKSMERYTEAQISYTDENGDPQTKTVYVYNKEDLSDNYSLYTIEEIEVNKDILNNVSLLPINGNKNSGLSGAYDIDVCHKLVDAWNKPFATLSPNELAKSTFFNYYTDMIGMVGERGNVLKNVMEKQEDMAMSLDNQRNEVAGVSSEEELTKLIKYQHAYNANSRYINVINEMLGTLIDRLGA